MMRDASTITDTLSLNFHLMHPGEDSQPGDPNPAFFLNGTYHLHYILRHPWHGPDGSEPAGTSFSFIHVTSPDLLHWTWQTTSLQPAFTGHGMFSGTGFITKEGKPAVIYAGVCEPRRTFIAIARDDGLESWEKPYAVLPDGVPEGKQVLLRGDPDLFRIGDTYYIYAAGDNLELCKSKDLEHWTYVGPLMRHELPEVARGEDTSCANLFRLGDRWMLLCISHQMGCRYYIGDWDVAAEQFIPEQHGRMNWRRADQSLLEPAYRDFFAPESVLTSDGRRVMWAWLATADPLIDHKSVQSLPRELSLHADGALRIEPLRELETLRSAPVILNQVILATPDRPGKGPGHASVKLATLDSDSVEVRLTVDRVHAERRRFGVQLFAGAGTDGLPVIIRPESGTIVVGHTEAPFAVADLPAGQDVELRIFADKYLVEVFVNGRQALVSVFGNYRSGRELRGYSFGRGKDTGSMTIRKVEIWKLQPTNQGFLDARRSRKWEPASRGGGQAGPPGPPGR